MEKLVKYHHLPFAVDIDEKERTIIATLLEVVDGLKETDKQWLGIDFNEEIKSGTAVCEEGDTWDEYFGTQLALGRAYISWLKLLKGVARVSYHFDEYPSYFRPDVPTYSTNSDAIFKHFKQSLIRKLNSGIEYHKAKLVKLYTKKYGAEKVPRSLLPKEDKTILTK